MLFRKMWIWGHRHTGERDRRVVACWTERDGAALEEMVEGFGKAGVEVMAFDPLRPDDHLCGIDPETLKSLSARHRLTLIEVGPLFATSPDRDRLVCLDGIHMTEPYHRLMAKEWLKYLAGARMARLRG